MNVAVILSAYNGEAYICEQIDSILAQSFQNFTLYIRDDGSQDKTRIILKQYEEREERIRVTYGENVGCIHSFLSQVRDIEADVYLFSDQDDVWVKDKIAWAVDCFQQADSTIPVLYHSDLQVVDQNLQMIHPSFLQYQNLKASDAMEKKTLFIQNFVVGCTMAVNKCLIERMFVNGMPEHIAMHDWWMALIARTQGRIFFDPRATLYYRQHNHNVLGAQESTLLTYLQALFSGKGLARFLRFRKLASEQAESFLQTYHQFLNPGNQSDLKRVHNLIHKKGLIPVLQCFYHGIYLRGRLRNISLIYAAFVASFVFRNRH